MFGHCVGTLYTALSLQNKQFTAHSSQAFPGWLVGITKTIWKTFAGEITAQKVCILYENGDLNTQDDALSRLTSIGLTTILLGEKISMYSEGLTADGERAAFVSNSNASDKILLKHEDIQNTPLIPITSTKKLREQQNNSFCQYQVKSL